MSIFEMLWTDTMSTERTETIRNEWGVEEEVTIQVLDNIKCQLSKKTSSDRVTVESANVTSKQEFTIFSYYDLDVKQNDIIYVTRAGKTYQFKANEPMLYEVFNPHLEIKVEQIQE